jgi:NDP-sugar pyrophosphorylase family protein
MKAVILAGGKGTRLAPYTKILPKSLMPIGDMPIVEIILQQMRCAGVDHVVLTVGDMAEFFRLFFQDGERVGLKISYSFEDVPLGTAGPLAMIPGINKSFLVSNGDVLTTLDIADLVDYHKENQAAATIAMHHRQVKIDLGVIELDDNSRVQDYIEKPAYDYMVSMGIYVFEPLVLDYIPRDQYMDFPDLIKCLLEDGQKVIGYPFTGYWQDLGRPDDYEQAAKDFDNMRSQFLPDLYA